jgi:hypothetical protein
MTADRYSSSSSDTRESRDNATNLDAALHYASLGMPVFPVWPVLPSSRGFTCKCGKTLRCASPGKHPIAHLAPRGLKDATVDEGTIKEWWHCEPDANIGLATGSVIVIDIDPRHDGEASLVQLEADHGSIPPTWRVSTGGGGLHIYLKAPTDIAIRNSAGLLGAGIDVRGWGGYVIAPPSKHISGGQYTWQSRQGLAPMPDWVIAALAAPRIEPGLPSDRLNTWRELVRNGVTEGRRNDSVAQLSGLLLRRGLDPLLTLEFMLTWNIARCRPPLAASEVEAVVDSIAGREMARRRHDR